MLHLWKSTATAVLTTTSSLLLGNPNLLIQQTRVRYTLCALVYTYMHAYIYIYKYIYIYMHMHGYVTCALTNA
jgi:hypothetical protein